MVMIQDGIIWIVSAQPVLLVVHKMVSLTLIFMDIRLRVFSRIWMKWQLISIKMVE